MNKIINWHKTYISNDIRYASMHYDMALKMQKENRKLTFDEYSRMFKKEGLDHMNEESFNSYLEE